MKKQILVLSILSISTLITGQVSAEEIKGLTVFGDSLSDNGNAFKATNGFFPPNNLYPSQGRFSNGQVWVEYFNDDPRFTNNISNFAFGGAQTGTENAENLKFSPGFLPFPLPGLQTEIDQVLAKTPRLDSNRLYVIWAGGNDYLNAPPNPIISVTNLTTAINKLTSAGANNLLIVNLPDLGNIPLFFNDPLKSNATQLTLTHNQALKTALQALKNQNNNLNIIPLDFYSLVKEVSTDPNKYGLKNITEPCLQNPACTNPDEFLFWDPIHPTAKAHQLISQYALSVLNGPIAISPQADFALQIANGQTRVVSGRLLTLRSEYRPNQPTNNSPSYNKQLGEINVSKQIGNSGNSQDKWGFFINGDVNFGQQNTTTNQSGFNYNGAGVTVGTDYRFTKNLALGVAFSYGGSDQSYKNNLGKVSADSYGLSIYSGYNQDKFYLDGLISYGWNNYDITRNTGFFDRKAISKTDGNQFGLRLNTGYNLGGKDLEFIPNFGVRYHQVNISKYTENGAESLNMNVSEQTADSLIANLGVQMTYNIRRNFGTFSPYFGINYEHELANESRNITTELVNQRGLTWNTKINTGDRDYLRLKLGMQTKFVNNLSVSLGYETLLGKQNVSDNYINGQIRWQF
ncbi:autotransporter domain-containing protein [Cylindrospermopsis raciborskii]|uniref:autotransporter domain-containing protein n=1 Tax=Cylindrospermopsis raciborskii TaxID=77022 RepID=UPI001BAB4D36|nr:autotransporter domain-containing protein [Cylindrospermopsis raciborskii]MBU6346262.1 autotransporter domain-containing protein [Cyanobacteria bacterium REEB494]